MKVEECASLTAQGTDKAKDDIILQHLKKATRTSIHYKGHGDMKRAFINWTLAAVDAAGKQAAQSLLTLVKIARLKAIRQDNLTTNKITTDWSTWLNGVTPMDNSGAPKQLRELSFLLKGQPGGQKPSLPIADMMMKFWLRAMKTTLYKTKLDQRRMAQGSGSYTRLKTTPNSFPFLDKRPSNMKPRAGQISGAKTSPTGGWQIVRRCADVSVSPPNGGRGLRKLVYSHAPGVNRSAS